MQSLKERLSGERWRWRPQHSAEGREALALRATRRLRRCLCCDWPAQRASGAPCWSPAVPDCRGAGRGGAGGAAPGGACRGSCGCRRLRAASGGRLALKPQEARPSGAAGPAADAAAARPAAPQHGGRRHHQGTQAAHCCCCTHRPVLPHNRAHLLPAAAHTGNVPHRWRPQQRAGHALRRAAKHECSQRARPEGRGHGAHACGAAGAWGGACRAAMSCAGK